jgi:hypothetical protein
VTRTQYFFSITDVCLLLRVGNFNSFEHLIHELFPIEFLEQENIEVPDQIAFTWIPFLQYCNENELLNALFDKLTAAYTDETTNCEEEISLRQKFLLSWILYFLKANVKNGAFLFYLLKVYIFS